MSARLASPSSLLIAVGAIIALCHCDDARSGGFWPGYDASARVPAEASVGGSGFAGEPPPDAGCSDCPPVPDGGTCPATWDEANHVDAGVFGCPASECAYPQGTCVCFWGCEDPGARGVTLGGAWSCTPATPECPSPRPESGTPCGDAGHYCQYGPLCCEGSWTMACTNGLWDGLPGTGCP